jgi:hypothetical protein
MSARDDYPSIASFAGTVSYCSGEMQLALDEIDLLRAQLAATQEALRVANRHDDLRRTVDMGWFTCTNGHSMAAHHHRCTCGAWRGPASVQP